MPKAVQYTKGSIIYFAGDRDERVFILQQGIVILTSTDIETGAPVTEQIRNGEFFGVKSALGRFPREETATVLTDTLVVAMTVQEFEKVFSSNQQVILKMLRVFSNQLRQIHKKTESILNKENKDAKLHADRQKKNVHADDPTLAAQGQDSALKQFSLPAFEKKEKMYEPGQVIISEFEPGDCFYLIQSGNVQLVKCVNGAKKNLDILKPGEFFGEMAILDNSPRSATCVAVGNVECLEFRSENFELLITGNPQIAMILLKLFCKRIYDQKRRFRILVIKDLTARLADVFLMFDEMNPVDNPNDRQRKFMVTTADLAHWAGLSLEATRDEVNKLVEKRKIEVYDTYMIVANIADMKRIVDTRAPNLLQK